MTLCCVYGCSSYSGKNVQFFSFPRKDKHHGTFKKWVSFCKRKNFVPSSGTRICSKHFRTEDMNQSDLLRKQLMPNENIRIRLNVDAVPTVRFDDEKITPKTVRRQLLRTSTPKKVKLQPSTSTNIICMNNCQEQNSEEYLINSNVENKNDKGIQCDMDNETNTDATESFDFPSDISSTDDESETTYGEDDEQLDYLSAKTHSLEKVDSNASFIVFWDCLSELFINCRQCSSKIISKTYFTQGALLSITTVCNKGHKLQWSSQKKIGRRPQGNILIGSALMLSGVLFTQMTAFCQSLNLSFFSRPVYDNIIQYYTGRVICEVWDDHRKKNLELLKNSDIWLSGDGQFDSPGFCAKYCTYSIMDLHTSKIIDFKLVQKGMFQGDLERKACELLLENLTKEENMKIKLFLSDRHKGIRYYLRTQHPEIEHEFDIWHLTKSLMKRLKTLEKKHPDVFLWKSSINNHLWWSAQTCQGNGKILVEKFLSVLHHISNEHEWETSGEIKRCEHESISEKESNEKLWINPLSESFFALKKILTAKDFIKDLEQAKHFVHTGRLESYHNVRLKYMPKRIHLKYNGMYLRSILAILDHNYNTGKNIIGDKMVFSKSLRKYTIKNTYERSKTDWRKQIMNKIEELSKENILEPMNISENVSVPQNIVLLPKPDLVEMREKKYSRFSNK